ncbi:hypothetical protein OPV22_009564 [Ensete ventricosum]|uniref:UDP-glycosyltransferases domain-containing protein n=1 Tax=Ensete ventricosum TaxID=4639 RepID=A0AAV8RDL6_ENSVE|nr:hypothetical protein OPV22_009564 [Ensete ventricosum]
MWPRSSVCSTSRSLPAAPTGTASYFFLWFRLFHLETDAPEVHLPGFFQDLRLHRSQMSSHMRAATGRGPWPVFFRRQMRSSLGTDDMIWCYTVEEVEVVRLQLLRNSTGLRVWPIGRLLPMELGSSCRRSERKLSVEVETCMRWVIYVNTISTSQMTALGQGMEASGVPFVWVVRPPLGFDLNSEFRGEWPPAGLERRTREAKQGLAVRRWAPQFEIL